MENLIDEINLYHLDVLKHNINKIRIKNGLPVLTDNDIIRLSFNSLADQFKMKLGGRKIGKNSKSVR